MLGYIVSWLLIGKMNFQEMEGDDDDGKKSAFQKS